MGLHITRYKTEEGKTRKVDESDAKASDAKASAKTGVPDHSGADNKNQMPASPAK